MSLPPRRPALAARALLLAFTAISSIVLVARQPDDVSSAQSTAGAAGFIGDTAATGLKRCSATHFSDNLRSPLHSASDAWFDVHAVESGVFALVESRQQQEVISWLVVGTTRALLFDTGMGMRPLRPVVERLTALPVTVLNSHTHLDHVGGNAEFNDVRAMGLPFTRVSMRGKTHAQVADEATPAALCGNTSVGFDPATYRIRPWRAAGALRDGDTFDLGGRTIDVVAVPGHTPDAIALLDGAAGLLWTGDTFYAGPIWLFMPETDLDAYLASITKLAALAPSLRRVLPAHNTVVAAPSLLGSVRDAMRAIRSGTATGTTPAPGQRLFTFDGFSVLVAHAALTAWQAAARAAGPPALVP
jgi:glyoxylase-like metal-dependent hydrolase (beta-lactamase superfamily II)